MRGIDMVWLGIAGLVLFASSFVLGAAYLIVGRRQKWLLPIMSLCFITGAGLLFVYYSRVVD
jgi:hypothetical protein